MCEPKAEYCILGVTQESNIIELEAQLCHLTNS